jgi:aquaporin Z
MIAAYVFGDVSGGIVNPAVTLGGAIAGKISWRDAGIYMIAQLLGGIAAGFSLLTILGPMGHLGATTINTNLISVPGGFMLEALGTFFLTTTALYTAMSDRTGNAAPLAIGFTLVMIVTFMGPLTGASVNPARTLGPAIAGDFYPHIWVYLIATPLGGLVAGLLYKLMQGKTDMHFREALK